MEPLFATITAFLIGIGLAASCGFRVFVPMLVMSLAVKGGLLTLSDGWHWLGTWPALVAFSVASVVEIVAFYIPYVANLLDALATPAAIVAGTIATAACLAEMNPLLQWSTALIAGGGVAAAVQATTAGTRLTSTIATGGVADFLVATGEVLISGVLSLLAIVAPLVAGALVCAILYSLARTFLRRKKERIASTAV